ncbi:hypothetical protein ISCGN_030230 [Ixodes scapularis]
MDDWERQETGAGIPYYVSHRLEKTQWDHPEMVAIMDKLTSFNDIKYAAYRTGAKLICLQKELLLSNVHVSMLPGVFGCRGLEGSGQQELLLGCSQAEAVLEELYRRAPGVHQQKVPLLAALALNLLQNLFDAKRKGTIQVVQMKVALFVLCAGRLLDKLKYMCGELQDGSQRIPLEGLEAFLHNISKVPELLGEKLSFGAHLVPAAVESCRKLCSQPSVPSDLFLGWLLREPQNLVWISTFYRMRSTENVAHPVKCGACKASPVVGLRYQCLQCLGYDLCQSCFLHGMISKNHSIKHRMQEHCQQVGDATGRNMEKEAAEEREATTLAARLAELEAQLDASRAAQRESERGLEQCASRLERREAAVRTLSGDVVKANEIIRRLQGELRALHGQLGQREGALADKERRLEALGDTADQLRAQHRDGQAQLERARLELSEAQAQLAQCQRQVKTHENVIQWLNQQLNQRMGAGQASQESLCGRGWKPRCGAMFRKPAQDTGWHGSDEGAALWNVEMRAMRNDCDLKGAAHGRTVKAALGSADNFSGQLALPASGRRPVPYYNVDNSSVSRK